MFSRFFGTNSGFTVYVTLTDIISSPRCIQ
jgi:hypothetical protein